MSDEIRPRPAFAEALGDCVRRALESANLPRRGSSYRLRLAMRMARRIR